MDTSLTKLNVRRPNEARIQRNNKRWVWRRLCTQRLPLTQTILAETGERGSRSKGIRAQQGHSEEAHLPYHLRNLSTKAHSTFNTHKPLLAPLYTQNGYRSADTSPLGMKVFHKPGRHMLTQAKQRWTAIAKRDRIRTDSETNRAHVTYATDFSIRVKREGPFIQLGGLSSSTISLLMANHFSPVIHTQIIRETTYWRRTDHYA